MKLHGDNVHALGQIDYRSKPCDAKHVYIETLGITAAKREKTPDPIQKEIEFWVQKTKKNKKNDCKGR